MTITAWKCTRCGKVSNEDFTQHALACMKKNTTVRVLSCTQCGHVWHSQKWDDCPICESTEIQPEREPCEDPDCQCAKCKRYWGDNS